MSCPTVSNDSGECMFENNALETMSNDNTTNRQSEEEAVEKMKEKCSVCLGNITDPTRLESCDHSFCYNCIRRWLLHCEINSCPLCKKPITCLLRVLNAHTSQKILMNELEDELASERRATRCNAVPLVSERMLLTKRIHDLRALVCRLENCPMSNEREYRERVSELTALRLLTQSIDDRSITRSELTSNIKFRFVIYCCDAPAFIVDSNDNPSRRNFTVKLCRENMESNRERVVPFIINELIVITNLLKRELRVMTRSVEGRYAVANRIFESCGIYQIMAPPFKTSLISIGFPPFISERFQHELFEFASSGLECEDYWKIVGYRLRGVPVSTPRQSNIVVVLDDVQENAEDEDDILIIEDPRHNNESSQSLIPFSPALEVEDVYGHRWDTDPMSFYAYRPFRPRCPRVANLGTTVVLSSDEESDGNSDIHDDRMDTSEESAIDRSIQRESDALNVTSSTSTTGSPEKKKTKKTSHSLQRASLRRIDRAIKKKEIDKIDQWAEFCSEARERIDQFKSKCKTRKDDGDRHRHKERDKFRLGYRGSSHRSRNCN
ncbi:unnamed protein product [Auanema sp. JU1783]|nr:unnamed protein product [Auanema sp. JU1783]